MGGNNIHPIIDNPDTLSLQIPVLRVRNVLPSNSSDLKYLDPQLVCSTYTSTPPTAEFELIAGERDRQPETFKSELDVSELFSLKTRSSEIKASTTMTFVLLPEWMYKVRGRSLDLGHYLQVVSRRKKGKLALNQPLHKMQAGAASYV
ncbi:hypothetical protein J6590_094021 [Homalodisca vitripennis]|nr:hypothetical protein J6590_094021 [Homalodisca vitripennis]